MSFDRPQVERVISFDAASRRQREQRIEQLKGEVANLRAQSDKEAREAAEARAKATAAKEAAVKAETAAIREEGEAAEAKRRLDVKIAELARAQGTPAAPAQPAPVQPPRSGIR